MDSNNVIAGILTLIGVMVTAYVSWRLGRMTFVREDRKIENEEESDFQKTLLELIQQQELKLEKQDKKIDKLETLIDNQKTLSDELRKANFNLTLENQRLTKRIRELEEAEARLRMDIETLKQAR